MTERPFRQSIVGSAVHAGSGTEFHPESSFRRSILAVSLIAIALAFIVIVAMAAIYNNQKGIRDLKQRLDLTSSMAQQSLSVILGRRDRAMASERLHTLGLDPYFEFGVAVDPQGRPLIFETKANDLNADQIVAHFKSLPIPPSGSNSDTILDNSIVIRRPLYRHDGNHELIGNLWAEYSLARVKERARLEFAGSAIGAVLILCLTGIILHISLGRITSPLEQLAESVLQIANGNVEADVPNRHRRDEIGALGRAIQFFKEKLAERAALQSEKELSQSHAETRQKRLEAMLDQFRLAVADSLEHVRVQGDAMTTAATHLAGIATQSSRQAHEAASAITESSANVRTVARASEELSSSITEIERQVTRTRRIVADAATTSTQTREATDALVAKAAEIGEIIALIQTIAEQTNMLALNATIEAVKAGEAGRGFAVVAHEVKSLAGQTTKAAQHIADHALAIQAVTDNVIHSIISIAATMAEAQRSTEIIAVAVQQQSNATTEISGSVAETASGTEVAAGNVSHVAASAAQTDASANHMHRAAANVALQATRLSETVDGFLRNVAAI
jgi:methyl-accepting chemotaxis protein